MPTVGSALLAFILSALDQNKYNNLQWVEEPWKFKIINVHKNNKCCKPEDWDMFKDWERIKPRKMSCFDNSKTRFLNALKRSIRYFKRCKTERGDTGSPNVLIYEIISSAPSDYNTQRTLYETQRIDSGNVLNQSSSSEISGNEVALMETAGQHDSIVIEGHEPPDVAACTSAHHLSWSRQDMIDLLDFSPLVDYPTQCSNGDEEISDVYGSNTFVTTDYNAADVMMGSNGNINITAIPTASTGSGNELIESPTSESPSGFTIYNSDSESDFHSPSRSPSSALGVGSIADSASGLASFESWLNSESWLDFPQSLTLPSTPSVDVTSQLEEPTSNVRDLPINEPADAIIEAVQGPGNAVIEDVSVNVNGDGSSTLQHQQPIRFRMVVNLVITDLGDQRFDVHLEPSDA